jgi:hypothetical protein
MLARRSSSGSNGSRHRPGAVILGAVSLLTATFTVAGAPPAVALSSLAAPKRIADTRPTGQTADGFLAGQGLLAADSIFHIAVRGRVGVSNTAVAVVLNVTVDGATTDGFVTLYPCDAPRPVASNLNFVGGRTAAVLAVTKTAADGVVCAYTSGATNLIVDVSSWFEPGEFQPLDAPQRIADSRETGATVDGRVVGGGPRAQNSTQRVKVAGRASVPTGVTTAMLSVTAVGATQAGFLTVYPCDQSTPLASNVNYEIGDTVANAVVSRLDAGGDTCVFNSGSASTIIDVIGWFPEGKLTSLPSPARILDTRSVNSTADGSFGGKGRRPDQGTLQLKVGDRVGVPSDATAVLLNITALGAEPGFITLHPRGTDRPVASNLNYRPGQTVANAAISRLGVGGDVCLFTEGNANVIVDVVGYLTGPPPPPTGPDCPGQSLFPTFTMVGLYGNGSGPALGVLGEQSPEASATRVAEVASNWKSFGRPVLGSFELIATTAQAAPGSDGLYRARSTDAEIQRYLDVARANGLYLVLDIQPGRSDFLTETKVYEKFLKEPNVGIALDPEWHVGPNSLPGVVIGSVSAAEVNEVSAYVAKIVADNHLPEKLFMVHQFQIRMIPDRDRVVNRVGLATTFHMDGFGSQSEKLATWGFTRINAPFHNGFKLFLRQDTNLFTPTQVSALSPRVDLVTYQ